VRRFRATREARLTLDLILLVVRVAIVWIFVYHGASTLFGAFHGGGIHGEAVYFSTVAHLHPATFFAVLDGSIQFFGGIAIGLGIFGRLAGVSIAGDMIMAMITVTFAQGLVGNAQGVGYQLNLALVALALVIAFLGTGRFSLDEQVSVLRERRRVSTSTPPAPPQ
jgi:putative oxidoreductase